MIIVAAYLFIIYFFFKIYISTKALQGYSQEPCNWLSSFSQNYKVLQQAHTLSSVSKPQENEKGKEEDI